MMNANTDSDHTHVDPVAKKSSKNAIKCTSEKSVIGWREWVVFPDFDNIRIKAKIDTGAQTSAIHAWNTKIVHRDGIDLVSFDLHPIQHDNHTVATCLAPMSDRRSVKNSGGQSTNRLFIKTHVLLGGKIFPIELSLTRRDDMGFRMLLGRAAVSGHYLVDPGKSFLLGEKI